MALCKKRECHFLLGPLPACCMGPQGSKDGSALLKQGVLPWVVDGLQSFEWWSKYSKVWNLVKRPSFFFFFFSLSHSFNGFALLHDVLSVCNHWIKKS